MVRPLQPGDSLPITENYYELVRSGQWFLYKSGFDYDKSTPITIRNNELIIACLHMDSETAGELWNVEGAVLDENFIVNAINDYQVEFADTYFQERIIDLLGAFDVTSWRLLEIDAPVAIGVFDV